ncbi:MAG: tRNA glutamyl-Q(34) synthetase GluQRS [Phycisphaerales bacterium]|nr:tRNA glutamyl-Q(34) synthetase GluQRS [Phycisphaerales bacterium]
MAPPTTRLAPSPTGALHLGNARTFLVNHALARRHGWRVVLRIEDLDTPRNKPGAADQTLRTLGWLGVTWHEGPLVQTEDLEPYRRALAELAAHGLAYPCSLSRTEIETAASAPQSDAPGEGPREIRFPPELRPPITPQTPHDFDTNWRFVTPDAEVTFTDLFAGPQRLSPSRTIGDFIVWTRRSQPAYQLAVVVDDHRQHVSHVVRGDDLLDSAARQLLLYRALRRAPEPHYYHLPLVVGADGRRLAKRHGDSRLDRYHAVGVPPERIIGLAAHWCGITPEPHPMPLAEFVERLDLATMPRLPAVFTPEHDAWLLRRS